MQKKALPVRALDHQQQWLCPCPREPDTWAGRTRSRCSLWLGEVRRKGSLRLPRDLDRGTSEQFIRKSLTLTFSPDKRLSFRHLSVPRQGTSRPSYLFAWKMPPTASKLLHQLKIHFADGYLSILGSNKRRWTCWKSRGMVVIAQVCQQ